MKIRSIISAGILVACLGIVLAVLAMLPPHPGVTKRNFDRIEVGMSHPEVEAILGSDRGGREIMIDIVLPRGHEYDVWGGDEGYANITFDERRRMVHKDWEDAPLAFLERLRRWLSRI